MNNKTFILIDTPSDKTQDPMTHFLRWKSITAAYATAMATPSLNILKTNTLCILFERQRIKYAHGGKISHAS